MHHDIMLYMIILGIILLICVHILYTYTLKLKIEKVNKARMDFYRHLEFRIGLLEFRIGSIEDYLKINEIFKELKTETEQIHIDPDDIERLW